ncbi:MAG: alpha/beta fold hydrolase [Propionibacteriales bacterium]|nr:alpha/beta fold hydrolase [Propionibacteriales bacterium]
MTDRLDISVGNVRLACHVSGAADNPPMVLLHALGEQGSTWDAVTAEFEQSFRVLAIDLRGHGESDRPGAYSFELMRDDVLGVLDHLSLDEITLVGHSMGGAVAYLLAQEQPSRIDRLVVEDAPPPFPRDRALPARPAGPLPFDWAVVPAIAGRFNAFEPAWWDRLSAITAPTLLIAGGPSSHIPQDKLKEVATQIPTCSIVTIPVGHHIHEARPTEFNAAVARFLRA